MPIRAMIFDFDGTIADTLESVISILNGLSAEFGYRQAAPEEIPTLRAMSAREVALRLGVSWHQLPRIATRVRQEMGRKMVDVAPCAGMPAALVALRARGLKLGMLTSNSRANVDAFLSGHPQLSFDFISTGSGLFGKQRRLKRLLQQQKLALAEACYVGDEVRDIEAAQQLGLRMIAVSWGYCSPTLLASSAPDHLITSPDELLALLTTWSVV
jgi:phosphoglycolate phosphatase